MSIPFAMNRMGIRTGIYIPTDGLILYAPLSSNKLKIPDDSFSLLYGIDPTYTIIDGIKCAAVGAYPSVINYPLPSGFPSGKENISFSIWIKYLTGTNFKMPFCYGSGRNSPNTWIFFPTYSDTKIKIGFCDNTFTSNANVSINKWMHIAVSFSGSSFVLYLNSTPTFFGNNANRNTNLNDITVFSSNSYASNNFCSYVSVSSLRIYNRVLSQTEIRKLYNEFHPTN